MPKVAAATALALLAETYYTVARDLPSYDGWDASVVQGHPDGTPVSIVALGDSTLTGPGLEGPHQIWIRQAIARLDPRYRVTLRSLAVGGARTADVLEHQIPAVHRADIAVVVAGSNDALHGIPASVVEANLRTIATELLGRSRFVIMAGVGDLGSIPRMPTPLHSVARRRGRTIDAVIRDIAVREPRLEFVAMWELTAAPFQREATDIFAGDLFHPNADGHRIWADAFYPSLLRALAAVEAGSDRDLNDAG